MAKRKEKIVIQDLNEEEKSLLIQVAEHLTELREAWSIGDIRELNGGMCRDGHLALRSNRNWDLEWKLRKLVREKLTP